MITLRTADAAGLRWAQAQVTAHHYLRKPVDSRCRPFAYLVEYEYQDGAGAAAGPRIVGVLIFGRPEATCCYDGALTYGSLRDVQAGRARFDRWEVINLARVWFNPVVQPGGALYGPAYGIPGYVDRRDAWRSTMASTTIQQALARVGYDYLVQHPPCFPEEPYELKVCLSYCDTTKHRGTIYRAAGFDLARTNEHGIQTWFAAAHALSTYERAMVEKRAGQSWRSRRYRSQRAVLERQEQF
jgi:hypothetical protein